VDGQFGPRRGPPHRRLRGIDKRRVKVTFCLCHLINCNPSRYRERPDTGYDGDVALFFGPVLQVFPGAEELQ